MRLHHARAQPPPAIAAARRRLRLREPRRAPGRGVPQPVWRLRELSGLRVRDRGSARRRGRRRRAAGVPPRAGAAGARRREARAGREAGVSAHGGLPHRGAAARDAAGRVVLVGENDHYKPLAVRLRALLARRRDRRDGVRALHDDREAAEDRRRLAQRRGDGRRRRVFRGRDPLAACRRQPRPADLPTIHGFRPAAAREGAPATAAHKSMLVAFRYDNGAVGSLYYSREIPSLFRGLRLSKLYGRDGVISFESNGVVLVARGRGLPRIVFPGFRDIRGYKAMYRDFRRAIATGTRARDEPRARDGGPAADGPGLRQPVTERFDVIIIGSGAGGGTIAHALAPTGARILILERGDFVPQEEENWSADAVWKELRYRTPELWLDEQGRRVPALHALQRRRQHQVLGQRALPAAARGFPGGPARRRRVAGVADRLRHARAVLRSGRAALSRARRGRRRSDRAAARTVSVSRRCRTRPAWRVIAARLREQGLHPSPLPLGLLNPGDPDGCRLCNTCNSFVCRIHAKSDADVIAVRPAAAAPQRHALDRRVCPPARHRSVRAQGRGGRRRTQRRRSNASRRPPSSSSCGAVNSAALLLRSGVGQASRRPGELVRARRPPLHGAPGDDAGGRALEEERRRVPEDAGDQRFLSRRPRTRRIRSARSSRRGGRTPSWPKVTGGYAGAGSGIEMRFIPEWAYGVWVSRATDWLAMTEDLPDPENRVRSRRRPHRARRTPEQHAGPRASWSSELRTMLRSPRLLVAEDLRALRSARGTRRTSAARWSSAPIRARRSSIRSAARTTSRTCSSSTRRSSPRRPRSIPG